jgi:hypothetical protein
MLFVLSIFTNTSIENIIYDWFILTALIAPAISIYWIVCFVKGIPPKIFIALIGIAIHLLFMYEMNVIYFSDVVM